jgi:hypothetical protein
MKRVLAIMLLVAACGPSATTPPAEPSIVLTGDSGGVSKQFTLAGGSYSVDWSAADAADCPFYLYLSNSPGGDVIKDVPVPLSGLSGTTNWSAVPAGSYVLQEDQTGLLSCTGPWSATINPR